MRSSVSWRVLALSNVLLASVCAVALALTPLLPITSVHSASRQSEIAGTGIANAPTTSFPGTVTVPESFGFEATGSLGTSRSLHTATLLGTGKVLVAGGASSLTTELYDPAAGSWGATGNLGGARSGHTAVLLANGKVLVAGGTGTANNVLVSAELYDPATGQWSATGSMTSPRVYHTATRLNNGKVLVAGGVGSTGLSVKTAELYDPETGQWSATGSMTAVRSYHTATLLQSGKVLVAGGQGSGSSAIGGAEQFDPDLGTWTATGTLNAGRQYHTATLLNNGKVLVAGGASALVGMPGSAAELYDPTGGSWTPTGSLGIARHNHTATLLGDGKVLVVGGYGVQGSYLSYTPSAEMYDPSAETWAPAGNLGTGRFRHTTTLLFGGKVVVVGGFSNSDALSSVEIGTRLPANTFTATLTLPSSWTPNPVAVQVTGSTTGAALAAFSLSNDGTTWGPWLPATANTPLDTTWDAGWDGADKEVRLRARDSNGIVGNIATGTVNVDSWKPSAVLHLLPEAVNTDIALSWYGEDNLSGVVSYDVQVGAGLDGPWTDAIIASTSTSGTYTGVHGTTSYFRIRARDVAGNVGDWPTDYNYIRHTLVDMVAPTGTVVISGGEPTTSVPWVTLTLTASDDLTGISQMSFSNDGATWGDWQGYYSPWNWTLTMPDGDKTVYARFQDGAGNVSTPATATINLAAYPEVRNFTINGWAQFTNSHSVTLSLEAVDINDPVEAIRMSFSGDGITWDPWIPYVTTMPWVLPDGDGTRSACVRTKDAAGNISPTYTAWIEVDTVQPSVNSLSVNGGSPLTNSRNVNLTLTASDPGHGTSWVQMSFSNDGATWSAWVPFAASSAWETSAGDGSKSVSARVRDGAGNVSGVVSSSIELDTTPPNLLSIVINGGALYTPHPGLDLTISATDPGHGTAGLQMSFSDGGTWTDWEAYSTTAAWALTSPDGVKTIQARFRDLAGNVSPPVSDTIALDTTPPTGSVRVETASGASPNSGRRAINLILSATDAVSGVDSMRIGNQPDLSSAAWQPYAESASWDLPSGGTVYVQFRDRVGNVSTAYSARDLWRVLLPIVWR
jgi:N-acetylneuraminic acid mutarotase